MGIIVFQRNLLLPSSGYPYFDSLADTSYLIIPFKLHAFCIHSRDSYDISSPISSRHDLFQVYRVIFTESPCIIVNTLYKRDNNNLMMMVIIIIIIIIMCLDISYKISDNDNIYTSKQSYVI